MRFYVYNNQFVFLMWATEIIESKLRIVRERMCLQQPYAVYFIHFLIAKHTIRQNMM